MQPGKIVVIGSSNTDMVVSTDHIPAPGETILSESFFMNPGGKGANQAVAIARLGGDVVFIGKIGDDIFGKKTLEVLEKEGIATQHIFVDRKYPSGVALITVDKSGENTIVVAPGSNARLFPEDLDSMPDIIASADIILMQLEIPVRTIQYVVDLATDKATRIILNPAPMTRLPGSLLQKIDIITPNETEASMLTGVKITGERSAGVAAGRIRDMGVEKVVITMGATGSLIYESGKSTIIPAYKVSAVDTTAAGDVFNGAMAVSMAEGGSLVDAVRFATKAAAISVTRRGAQNSAPYRDEINKEKF